MRNPLFLGNWKMNLLPKEVEAFAASFLEAFKKREDGFKDCGFAPPFTSLIALKEAFAGSGIRLGAQNVHWLESGAHTGEVSPGMLIDLGLDFAIVGHSERRQFYGENDADVSKRAKSAIDAGLTAVVCVGEPLEEFEAGNTEQYIVSQLNGSLAGLENSDLSKLVIAYEPRWAIGTGKAATPEIAQSVHSRIREELSSLLSADLAQQTHVLYGGSTTPDNVSDLVSCEDVDGALVGGASLKPDVFWELIKAGRS